MKKHYRISQFELVMSLSNALDLVIPRMANHHKRVGYIALRIAASAGYPAQAKQEIVIAASLHDIGALSTTERIEASMANSGHHSAGFGYELLRKFTPFCGVAELIRFHHVPWEHGHGQRFKDAAVPMGSHILNLANRIDALIDQEAPILAQVDGIRGDIDGHRGSIFVPEFVDAFMGLSRSESFWLDLASPGHEELLGNHAVFSDIELDLDGLLEFAELWGQVIDFRSRYTATHSSGVAVCAHVLARFFGFPETRCKQLKVAGFLHDIGKLAIPVEVLDKPGKLDPADRLTVRAHSYYSFRILQPIAGLEDIAAWCGLHHEQLDGAGYPYRVDHSEIALEARLLAVADVFSALTEDRPYREGLAQEEVVRLLREMAAERRLDAKVVECLCDNYFVINACRKRAQEQAVRGYEEFTNNLRALDLAWAKEAHLSWMERLTGALREGGVVEREEFLSPHRCPLGRWHAGDGQANYGHLAEFRALERPHRELHRKVEELFHHLEAGHPKEVELCAEGLDDLSKDIVQLLDGIDQRGGFSSAHPGVGPGVGRI